jgi:Fic family protein
MPCLFENIELPEEAIHLIDGDDQTCWMSEAQPRSRLQPVVVRIDLPLARKISKVVLRKRPLRPDTERRNYEAELNEYLQWLNANANTECFHTAATAYRRYIYMHPFKGGNGHLARMILALTMHKYGYPAIVVPNKWKAEYDSLIKNYDEDNFADFLRKCCLTTLNILAANLGTTYSERKTRHIRGINPETEILEYISRNPGIKSIQMKKQFPKISYTKMTRIIRALREEGKITFQGATKSGGYYAAEQ